MKKYFKKIYNKSIHNFYQDLEKNIQNNKKEFIVTANPETFINAENDYLIDKMLMDKEVTIVPDGIGVVKAARILNYNIVDRIPGIDITNKLLELGNKYKKSIYIFGSKQSTLDLLSSLLKSKYNNLKVIGCQNGYINNKEQEFEKILIKKPDIVIVALGIPEQEKLIYRYYNKFNKGIFIGVGGSLDVISGAKKRAPKLFINLNLEWLYRIIKEPNRIKRFYKNNVKFLIRIYKERKDN